MRILCSKSGLLFKTEYFPFNSDTATISHPCFYVPQKKLLSLTPKWAAGELSEVDSYLLYLALLNSTGQVEFRTHCQFTQLTSQVVAANLPDLVQVIGQINLICHPAFVIPKIAITKENHTLSNSAFWIANWNRAIEEFKEGYISLAEQQDLLRREAALEKLIKSQHKELQLAVQIANWAELAGAFPSFDVNSPFGVLSCAEYWKLIIRKCINAESIFAVPSSDIQELIEHCEDNIPHGTIYAHTLMQILRNGKQKQTNFLGLGDWESSSSQIPYLLVSSEDSVERANLELLIASAPSEEPKLLDYRTRFDWLKAHSKWRIAQAAASTQNTKETTNDTL